MEEEGLDPVNTDLNIDGPHSGEYSIAVAKTAAEAVRVLSHATKPHQDGLRTPSDVYDVTAELASMGRRLPQLGAQLTTWLETENRNGRVRDVTGADPVGAVSKAAFALGETRVYAQNLAEAYERAQNAIRNLCAAGTQEGNSE